MDNFYYLIAGFPELSKDWKFTDGSSAQSFLEEIKENCSEKDNKTIDTLMEGYDDDKLTLDFYKNALQSKDSFIKDYFTFDLNVRNAKVRFLNKALSRAPEQDVMDIETGEFEELQKVEAALGTSDILEREKGVDDLYWNKIDELTVFNCFDLKVVLGFLAKLHIINRWFSLDEKTGREMFKKLVDEVRGTFKGVTYDGQE